MFKLIWMVGALEIAIAVYAVLWLINFYPGNNPVQVIIHDFETNFYKFFTYKIHMFLMIQDNQNAESKGDKSTAQNLNIQSIKFQKLQDMNIDINKISSMA